MVSKNQLLGFSAGIEEEEEENKVEDNGPVKLYREDYPQGREFSGAEMIAMMKKKKWTEVKPVSKKKSSVKPSKIDLSEEESEESES